MFIVKNSTDGVPGLSCIEVMQVLARSEKDLVSELVEKGFDRDLATQAIAEVFDRIERTVTALGELVAEPALVVSRARRMAESAIYTTVRRNPPDDPRPTPPGGADLDPSNAGQTDAFFRESRKVA